MPQLQFIQTFDVNLQKLLEVCSDSELQELDMLLGSEIERRKKKKLKVKMLKS